MNNLMNDNPNTESENDSIKSMYNDAMKNVVLDRYKKDEIRNELSFRSVSAKHRRTYTLCYVAAAAALCVVIMCIPATRSLVSAAADYIRATFTTTSGYDVTYEENANGNSVSFTVEGDEAKASDVVNLVDGRLIFTYENEKIDITDKCSDTDYFRYEVENDDGGKSVFIAGGTTDDYGWAELVFDADGNYVFNIMNWGQSESRIEITTEENGAPYEPVWLKEGMHAEGVDTGDPSYDNLLLESATEEYTK